MVDLLPFSKHGSGAFCINNFTAYGITCTLANSIRTVKSILGKCGFCGIFIENTVLPGVSEFSEQKTINPREGNGLNPFTICNRVKNQPFSLNLILSHNTHCGKDRKSQYGTLQLDTNRHR